MRAIATFLTALATFGGPVRAQHQHHGAPDRTDSTVLAQQVTAVRNATERYRDFEAAKKAGYKRFGVDGPLMGEHWYHPGLVKGQLDLERPATLQYAVINGKRELVGVAYNVYQRPDEPLPEGFAGRSDHWHVHDVTKLARALVNDRPVLRRVVNRRIARGKVGAGDGRTQLVMVHAWIWSDNPDGMFAQQHRVLPYLRAGLPAEWAQHGDLDAAWGTALLRDGCKFELERLDRLAQLTDGQERAIRNECSRATERVQAATGTSAHAFNETAASAWRAVGAVRDRLLTPAQKRRLEAVVEPMHPAH